MIEQILSHLVSAGVSSYGSSMNKKRTALIQKEIKDALNGNYKLYSENFTVGYANLDVICYCLGFVFFIVALCFVIPHSIVYFTQHTISRKLISGCCILVGSVIIMIVGIFLKRLPVLEVKGAELEYKNRLLTLREIREIEYMHRKIKVIDQYGGIFFTCDEECEGAIKLIAWSKKYDLCIISETSEQY